MKSGVVGMLAAVLALAVAPTAFASHGDRGAGAPGRMCASSKVKGKKTADQRAAFKACLRDAGHARGHRSDAAGTQPSGGGTQPSGGGTEPSGGNGNGGDRGQGAPGQVCASLKVRGKKTPEQRAAFKACIQAAAHARGRHDGNGDDEPGDDCGDEGTQPTGGGTNPSGGQTNPSGGQTNPSGGGTNPTGCGDPEDTQDD